ncbi:MAG: hypothetical protein RL758_805 [Pseudomonadota bacterium]|jgi:cytoplasmic iron level regulating protein YaaA (DUF328/UPF0246 family)
MLFVISPAKALDYESPIPQVEHTKPLFAKQAAELIEVLREKSPQQIAELMDLSDALSTLNVARYQAWSSRFTAKNSREAVFAFDGDVYDGLQARHMAAPQLEWLPDHLRILSGLYGVLRPFDRMQAYRLEMGTSLVTDKGKNLYQFWGKTIAQHLQNELDAQDNPVLVNLASMEYFKSVDLKTIKAPVIECVFQEDRAGAWKVVSFMAKRARGLMTRFAAEQGIDRVDGLKGFNLEGYAFDKKASTAGKWLFRRRADMARGL